MMLCKGPAISLFSPVEMERLVCGNPNLDFAALRGAAKYEGGFTASSQAAVWLWELAIDVLAPAEQRMFLKFFTGTPRDGRELAQRRSVLQHASLLIESVLKACLGPHLTIERHVLVCINGCALFAWLARHKPVRTPHHHFATSTQAGHALHFCTSSHWTFVCCSAAHLTRSVQAQTARQSAASAR